jgi:hypothetical protein
MFATDYGANRERCRRAASSSTILLDQFRDGSDHTVDVALGHTGIDRQRKNSLKGSARLGEIRRAITKDVAVIRMKVQRDKMDGGSNVFLPQAFKELVPVNLETLWIQLRDKKMPCMLYVLATCRNLNFFEPGESSLIIHCDTSSVFPELIAFLQLLDSESGSNVG